MTAITVLLLLLNIALLAGVGHILYREVVTIRMTRQQAPPQLPAGAATIRELQTQLESQHQTELERLRTDARTTINELTGEVSHLHVDVTTLHGDVSTLHGEVSTLQGNLGSLPGEVARLRGELGTLDQSIGTLPEQVTRLNGELEVFQGSVGSLPEQVTRIHDELRTLQGSIGSLPAEIGRLHQELATLSESIQALCSQSTALAEELAARPAPPPALPDVISVTRTTGPTGAVSELYAQLARLEVAFLNLANPVLLPGEPFENADELPPETLRWESWKEIGDQTFGFAELYAAKRVLLDAGPRAAAGQFITGVRELMTTRIYPTLANPSRFDRGERSDKVKAAIAEMGQAIETVRSALETAHDGNGSRAEGWESNGAR